MRNFQIWRIKQAKAKTVALQLPEGLQLFACTLADIIGEYAGVEVKNLAIISFERSCDSGLPGGDIGGRHLRGMLRRRPKCKSTGILSFLTLALTDNVSRHAKRSASSIFISNALSVFDAITRATLRHRSQQVRGLSPV